MYYVYILKSLNTGKYYIGSTANIERRLKEHMFGNSRYTQNRGPWELVHFEKKKTLSEAEKREKFLKTGDGRRVLSNILKSKF